MSDISFKIAIRDYQKKTKRKKINKYKKRSQNDETSTPLIINMIRFGRFFSDIQLISIHIWMGLQDNRKNK